MRLFPLAVAAVLAASLAPAQNLLDPAAWKEWGQRPLVNVVKTSALVQFTPECGFNRSCPMEEAGLEQEFTVTTAGYFQFHARGWGGADGSYELIVSMDGHRTSFYNYTEFGITTSWYLAPGVHRFRLGARVGSFIRSFKTQFLNPSLTQVFSGSRYYCGPRVNALLTDNGDINAGLLIESSSASILAVSAGANSTGVALPGFGGLLFLDSTLVVLSASVIPQPITLDLTSLIPLQVPIDTLYFQAVDALRIGPVSRL